MLFIPNSEIKKIAVEVGFQEAGVAKACELEEEKIILKEWLQRKYHAGMGYMENHFEKRANPCLLAENIQSVISVLLSYKPSEEMSGQFKIAKYAYGADYHSIIKGKLYKMIAIIQSRYPKFTAIPCVDSAPVLEKAWAIKAGLGWLGKNACLINSKWGSFCFIGELICNAVSEYDTPLKNHCGKCSNCLQICPNRALEKPYLLNSHKCISYQTIENKSPQIPHDINCKNYIFGCDICQDSCIWNKKSLMNDADFEFSPLPKLKEYLQTGQIEKITKPEFKKIAKKSALSRISYQQFIRNIEQAGKSES